MLLQRLLIYSEAFEHLSSYSPEDLRNALKGLRPNNAVKRHITQVQQSLDKMRLHSPRKARFSRSQLQTVEHTRSPYIGVHIRSNQPNKEPALTLPENAYTPEAWATIKRMRSLTRLDHFTGEIERLLRVVSEWIIPCNDVLFLCVPSCLSDVEACRAYGVCRIWDLFLVLLRSLKYDRRK